MMKSVAAFALALILGLAGGAPVFAASLFVRDAKMTGKTDQARRSAVTDLVRASVTRLSGQELVFDESLSDAVLQPSLSGKPGAYVLRIDRVEKGRRVASAERAVGDWKQMVDMAMRATYDVTAGVGAFAPTPASSRERKAQAMSDETAAASTISGTTSVPVAAATDDDSEMRSSRAMDRPEPPPQGSNEGATEPMGQYPLKRDRSMATPAFSSNPDAANLGRQGVDNPSAEQAVEQSTAQSASQAPNQSTNQAASQPAAQSAGESAGQSRRELHPLRALRDAPSYWTIGLGPGFGVGVGSDSILYSIMGGYAWELNSEFVLKAIGQADVGTGRDNAHFYAATAGGDAYLTQERYMGGRPYVTADAGLGNARNQESRSQTGLALGGGAGFRFQSNDVSNMDLLLHYKLLADTIDGATPSVFTVRAALNF